MRLAQAGGLSFLPYLRNRLGDILGACTRCGKCVTVCAMVEPADLDSGDALGMVVSALDLLAGGERMNGRGRDARLHQQRQVQSVFQSTSGDSVPSLIPHLFSAVCRCPR